MSAKKEQELRKGIEVCQMLLERQDEMMELHEMTGETLRASGQEMEAVQKLLLKTVQRMTKLEEWRKDHIEQDMERRAREARRRQIRRVEIRRIRMVFNCLGLFFGCLFLGVAGGVTRETIQMVPGVMLMVGFGVISGICFCKGGAFDC